LALAKMARCPYLIKRLEHGKVNRGNTSFLKEGKIKE
jgi:hypothetical protein